MLSTAAKPFKDQNYYELKRQCLEEGKLFEDPEFPASDASLFYNTPPLGKVEWKRPKELSEDPHLVVNGISSHDLHQGKLGNCWFVAACSCLALRHNLWQKVVPDVEEQDWVSDKPDQNVGIFHFCFWCFGEWIDVVIDDRLPTVRNELIYCHSNDCNEFWSALLEKAYAKMAGSYEALDGGNTAEAIVDFTGAVAESIDMIDGHYSHDIIEQAKLFEDLLKVQRRGGLISCYIMPLSSNEFEGQTEMGLVKGHAYSVTEILMMPLGEKRLPWEKTKKLFMIRLRNPWGKSEWNGPWSDASEEWKSVSQAERKKLRLTIEDDGEFWMSFEDWCKNFTDVDVCRIVNTSLFSIHKTWEKKMIRGEWKKDPDPMLNRAGGCLNNKVTFLQNPQYVFDVKKSQDKVMICLQQKDQRIYKREGRGDNLVIGFEIFKVEANREYRMHTITVQEKMATSMYIDNRMVFSKVCLKQGRYVLVPTTFRPDIEAEFILRLFTDVPSELRELTLHKPKIACLDVLRGFVRRVSQVKVHSVAGLRSQDPYIGANPYIIIKCENQKVRSPVQKSTLGAVFNTQAIFYQRNIESPIVVQVWHSKLFCDKFLGQVRIATSPDDPRGLQKLQLQGRGSREDVAVPGHIIIKVVTSDDLVEL
ncbi:calpain-6 [Zootoca vivipara]|uniref:calpain-6 n=1 Tax=Zootoca vivipara TaxID=8524 RepID=UPI00159008C7|nr:calpain-6 [Zootoca vivipara]